MEPFYLLILAKIFGPKPIHKTLFWIDIPSFAEKFGINYLNLLEISGLSDFGGHFDLQIQGILILTIGRTQVIQEK